MAKQYLIDVVAERWKKTYFRDGIWDQISNKDPHDVYEKLLVAKVESQIVEIIGNNSWTRNNYDECGDDVDIVVLLGNGYHEYARERFCLSCVEKAVKLLEEASHVSS